MNTGIRHMKPGTEISQYYTYTLFITIFFKFNKYKSGSSTELRVYTQQV